MQIPKSVSVATDAEFNVNLGTMKYSLSEKLSSAAITEQMQESLGDSMKLYNYIRDDDADTELDEQDTLSYLIQYPVYEIPLDMTGYLDDLDFSGVFGNTEFGYNFDQKISVPKVSGSSESKIGISFVNEFKETINNNLSANDFTLDNIYEPGIKQEFEANHGSIEINAEAERIYYTSGSAIEIKFLKTDSTACTEGFVFNGRGFLSSDGSSEDLGTSGDFVSVKNGGTISIPLDRTEGLPSHFYVCLKGQSSGGDPLTQHSYSVSITLSDGSDLKKVKNILKTSAELGIESQSFNMEVDTASMVGLFESASIKDGNIKVYTTPETSGWENIDVNVSMNFNGSGIAASNIVDITDASVGGLSTEDLLFAKTVNLAGTNVSPSATALPISGVVNMEVKGATIDFANDISELGIVYSYEINSLENVTVNLASEKYSDIQTSYSLSTDGTGNSIELTDSLTTYVKKISFGEQHSDGKYYKHDSSGSLDTSTPAKGLGFKFKLVNTLKTDDIKINVVSDVMNYSLLNQPLPQTGAVAEEQTWVQYPEVDFNSLDSSQKNYVDFTFEFADSEITIDEIVLGEEYELSLAFEEMLYDWDKVSLNTDGVKKDGEQALESFDLNSLLEGLSFDDNSIKNIKISTLPVFFFAQKPVSENSTLETLINSLSISGDINIDYTKTEGEGDSAVTTNDTITLLDNATLTFLDEKVPWPADITTIIASEETQNLVGKDGVSYNSEIIPFVTLTDDANKKYSFATDLADIINEYPESLKFNYSLGLGSSDSETVIYSAMFDTSSGESSEDSSDTVGIKIDMAVLLSFDLSLTDDIVVDIMKFYSSDWETSEDDLLNRESAATYEKYAEYAGAIDRFAVSYKVDNNVFKGLELSADFSDIETGINKTITLFDNKLNELSFSSKEIEKILTRYPFHPSATMTLGGGTSSNPKHLLISRSQIDSEDGAYLGATVQLKLDLSNREAITIFGDVE